VEIGETEVDSSHYRVLFLAAFVLFMFTFVVNTIAETVRQRLRMRYGNL
jgi:phosphate transport system permease protein